MCEPRVNNLVSRCLFLQEVSKKGSPWQSKGPCLVFSEEEAIRGCNNSSVIWDHPIEAVYGSPTMSASTSTSAPLEQSTESIQLTSSASLQSSGSVTAEEKVAPAPEKLPPQIVTPNLDSREAFLQFCRQYAPYMEYPALFAKETATTKDMITSLTSRTDESGLLMDPLNITSENRTTTIIPMLKQRASQLPTTFMTIDKMQELLQKLKENVAEAQRRVDEAEKAYSSSLSVSKLFGVFSRKDKTTPTERPAGPLPVLDTKSEFARMREEVKTGATAQS